jgi:hypothetical protein
MSLAYESNFPILMMCRVGDLMMHQLFNSKERSKSEWTDLFAAADPRFNVKYFILVPPSIICTITALMDGIREEQSGTVALQTALLKGLSRCLHLKTY